MNNKIETIITCPNCKTKIDCENIKEAIHYRIIKAIEEVNKTI